MKKRRVPGIEVLEARETPDVSLGSAAACALPLPPATPVVMDPDSDPSSPVPADVANTSYLQALETVFSDAEGLKKLLARHAGSLPTRARNRL